ncbi:MAG: hypothetical protein MK108_13005 [Mariniblastus sp.]|nr:hypothetical protein [Mariniblastus sp.]
MKSLHLNLAITLVMVVTGMAAESAWAQGRGGFGGRMFGGGMGGGSVSEINLLAMDEVLDHLQDSYDLSLEAREEIVGHAEDAQDELQEERRAIMGDMRNMGQDEREAAMEELQEITEEINTDTFRTIKKKLNKKQLSRLNELKVQRMGVAALHDPVVQEMLEFDNAQVEKMNDAKEKGEERGREMMEDMRAQFQSGGGFDRDAMRESMMEMQEANKKDAMDCLTDKQKETFEKMKGEEFEFPEPQRGRRGRGGRQ